MWADNITSIRTCFSATKHAQKNHDQLDFSIQYHVVCDKIKCVCFSYRKRKTQESLNFMV